MKKCSHKKQKVVDLSILEEANEERDQACENTMITKNHYLTNILWRHLPKEGMTTLTKAEKDQRTLDTYEDLGDMKGGDNWFYSTKMTWWRNHPTKAPFNVEAISRWSHEGLLDQSMGTSKYKEASMWRVVWSINKMTKNDQMKREPDICQEGHFSLRKQWNDKLVRKVMDGWCSTKKKFDQRLHDIKGRKEL